MAYRQHPMYRHCRVSLALATTLLGPAISAHAQSEPYKTFDTRPVITQGPYLIATASTATTIVWLTDTPSHSLVKYARGAGLPSAALTESSEPERDGLVPVGLRHVVHLTGSSTGRRPTFWCTGAGHKYHLLVIGQDQVARVDATAIILKVVVTATDGKVVHSMEIPRGVR